MLPRPWWRDGTGRADGQEGMELRDDEKCREDGSEQGRRADVGPFRRRGVEPADGGCKARPALLRNWRDWLGTGNRSQHCDDYIGRKTGRAALVFPGVAEWRVERGVRAGRP